MKKILIPILAICITLTMSSCKKDTNSGQAGVLPQGKQMGFTLDGTAHNFSTNDLLAKDTAGLIHVYQADTTNNYFLFNFNKDISVGSYDFSTNSDFQFVYVYNVDSSDYYYCLNNSGSVNVTLHDKVNRFITGHFSCPIRKNVVPYDMKQVNSGTFSIHY